MNVNIHTGKRITGFVLLIFISSLLTLQGQFRPVQDKNTLILRLSEQAATIQSIYSKFIQEKHLDFLDETIVSKGKFWFRKENSLRWAYEDPYSYIIIIHGGRFFIRDGQDLSSFDIESNAAFREINELIVGMVRGNVIQEEKFEIEAYENESQFFINMVPRDPNMQEVISVMEIYFGRNDMMVDEIVMKEGEQDYTRITFTDRKINEIIPDSVFSTVD